MTKPLILASVSTAAIILGAALIYEGCQFLGVARAMAKR